MSAPATVQHSLKLRSTDEERALLGLEDRTLRLLRRYLAVRVHARKGVVTLAGPQDAVEEAVSVLEGALERIRSGEQVSDVVMAAARRGRQSRELAASSR